MHVSPCLTSAICRAQSLCSLSAKIRSCSTAASFDGNGLVAEYGRSLCGSGVFGPGHFPNPVKVCARVPNVRLAYASCASEKQTGSVQMTSAEVQPLEQHCWDAVSSTAAACLLHLCRRHRLCLMGSIE